MSEEIKKDATTKRRFLRISIKEQILIAKQLSILINAGMPIMQALQMLRKQANSRSSKHILSRVFIEVENGKALSSALGNYRSVFGSFAINLIHVGEASGTLNQNLSYLADELKKKQELRRKVISALVYPVFIGFATLGITVLLITYVFPKILPIFQSFKNQLPWSTRLLIAISNLLIHDWYYLLGGLIILVVTVVLLLRVKLVRLWFDNAIFYIPLLGPLFQAYYVANFTRTFGLLLKSDVRILEAIKILANTMNNTAYKKEFMAMGETIRAGERISVQMESQRKLFPTMLTQMVSVGELTGKLTGTLFYLSEIYEDDLNNLTKNLSTTIEPVLMIFMGLLVGFIAISIITPIYGITQNLHT